MKVDNGAEYLVTQMFFDNRKYFDFVDRCRAAGITVPIHTRHQPIHLMSQLTVLPKVFRSDIPEDLARELRKCTTDDEAKEVGVEWCIAQCKELDSAWGAQHSFLFADGYRECVSCCKEIY